MRCGIKLQQTFLSVAADDLTEFLSVINTTTATTLSVTVVEWNNARCTQANDVDAVSSDSLERHGAVVGGEHLAMQ